MAEMNKDRHDPGVSSLSDRTPDGLLQKLSALARATAEISDALLGASDFQHSVQLVAHRARTVAQADLAAVTLTDGPNKARVAAVSGSGREDTQVAVIATQGLIAGEIGATGDPLLIDDATRDDGVPRWLAELARFGPAMLVPVGSRDPPAGLAVARTRGERVFDPFDLSLLQAFASQAALALELQEAQRDRERLLIAADRIRIGQDLHDRVIQRLFATGLTLQGAINLMGAHQGKYHLLRAVDELDAIIREIRSSIFGIEEETQSGSPPD